MPEPAAAARDAGAWRVVKKRWRAWLRAVHRDFGYLAVGFTVIYAVSGIAQNHIEDWGDVSFATYERSARLPAIPAATADAAAIRQITDAVGLGTPTTTFRAGDEIRLAYGSGAKVTAITGATATQVTIQARKRRAFIGIANWLHTARGKKGWKYISDAYALFLLYLATSGLFMIKGRLGLRWRGALLVGIGVCVPIAYLAIAGGPDAQHTTRPDDVKTARREPRPSPAAASPSPAPVASPAAPSPAAAPSRSFGSDILKPLPPDDDGE